MTKSKQDRRLLTPDKLKLIISLGMTHRYSAREIAARAQVSPSTVLRHLNKVELFRLTDDLPLRPEQEEELINSCYPNLKPSENYQPGCVSHARLVPDFRAYALRNLEEKVDLRQLYKEYRHEALEQQTSPFSLAYFYKRVQLELHEMKQEEPEVYLAYDYAFGEYVQLDFTGDSYKLSTLNGEIRCWIMVMTFPASYYTIAGFVTAQSTAEACRFVGEAFRYIGSFCVRIAKVDNARAFVDTHRGYEAVFNQNFERYMNTLGVCLDAAPCYRGQSKSAVELSVRLIQDLLIRNKTLREHFRKQRATISEHSAELMKSVEQEINLGPFRRSSEKTRSYLFVNFELPACRQLSSIPEYEGEPLTLKVPRSYLITVNNHRYSVPYAYAQKSVDVYVCNDFIVIKYQGVEIARHLRVDNDPGKTVALDHMPKAHQDILARNELLSDEAAILAQARQCDASLYRFCLRRIEYDRGRGLSNYKALRCCAGMINFFKKATRTELIPDCIDRLLNLDPVKWNTYMLEFLYRKACQEQAAFSRAQSSIPCFEQSSDDNPQPKAEDCAEKQKTGSARVELMKVGHKQAYLRK